MAQNSDPMEENQDQQLEKKLRMESFLQKHHRIITPAILVGVLAMFVLPWIFASFAVALCIQVLGAGALFVLGKLFTTAFDKGRGNPIFRAKD